MTDAEKQALYLKRTTVRNDESQDGEIELPVKKATSKKTRAQINKQLRRQAQEAEETRARKQKKLDKSVGEVGAILKGFKATEAERAAQKASTARFLIPFRGQIIVKRSRSLKQ